MDPLGANLSFLRGKVLFHTQEMHRAAEAWKARRELIAETARVQNWDAQKERITCNRDVPLRDASSSRSVHAELLMGYSAALQCELMWRSSRGVQKEAWP